MIVGRKLFVVISISIAAATLLAGWNTPCFAAEEPTVSAAPETPTAPQEPKLDTGDNSWLLVSSALVLMMTGPGLALFYGGLVRKKNVLGVMMQCIFLMCLMTVIWAIYGYTLGFGGDTATPEPPKWIGNFDHLFMQGVQAEWSDGASHTPMHPTLTIPRLTHMLFQGMFFIITPALICGAFAERMKFSAMVLFSILWGTIVYCPLCHWVWGGGVLMYGSPNAVGFFGGGALDFAGGTVVHISSGVSALVCALLLGKRLGYGSEPMPPHNLTYTAIGAAMLWVGWFGFNAGSALAANKLAASAFTATHFAAASAGITWAVLEWILRGKPTVLGTCSGVVAGLVCITPAAGFVTPMPALLMGVAVGIVCYLACTALKSRFKYDDSLDAFGIHGVGGTLGAVLTGIFATRATGAFADGKPLGLLEGGPVLSAQIIAVLVTWALAIVATFVILKVLDATIGLRVSRQAEIEGLDFSQHGEEGYIYI
ncbi:MAG: ammonium transporter [Pirellulales bacterium]|nr:ammonium transporter [Pirellulales bacterium]